MKSPDFEWDDAKALANARKHRVTFEEAASVFGDDCALIEDDVEHSTEEERFIITGESWRPRTLLTVYTIVENDVIRIISSRPALPHERKAYEENKRRRGR